MTDSGHYLRPSSALADDVGGDGSCGGCAGCAPLQRVALSALRWSPPPIAFANDFARAKSQREKSTRRSLLSFTASCASTTFAEGDAGEARRVANAERRGGRRPPLDRLLRRR